MPNDTAGQSLHKMGCFCHSTAKADRKRTESSRLGTVSHAQTRPRDTCKCIAGLRAKTTRNGWNCEAQPIGIATRLQCNFDTATDLPPIRPQEMSKDLRLIDVSPYAATSAGNRT